MPKLNLLTREVKPLDSKEFHDFVNFRPWSPKYSLLASGESPNRKFNGCSQSCLRERLEEASAAEKSGGKAGFVEGNELDAHITTFKARTSLDTLNGAGCGGEAEMCKVTPAIKQEEGEGIGQEGRISNWALGEPLVDTNTPTRTTQEITLPIPCLEPAEKGGKSSETSSVKKWILCDVCSRWRCEKDGAVSPVGNLQHWSCGVGGRKCDEPCDWCKMEPCRCQHETSYSTRGFLTSGYKLPPGFSASAKFRAGKEPLTVGGPYLLYWGYCDKCEIRSAKMDRKQKVQKWLDEHRDHNPNWARLTELDFDFHLDERTKQLYSVFNQAQRAGMLRARPSDDIIPTEVVNPEGNEGLQEEIKQFEKLVRDCQINSAPLATTRKRKNSGDGSAPRKRRKSTPKKTNDEKDI